MVYCMNQQRKRWSYRLFSLIVAGMLSVSLVMPPRVSWAQTAPATVMNLPVPGTLVTRTDVFQPAVVRGINLHKDDPLMFDFIVDPGDAEMDEEGFEQESNRLIKYFLAALTIPEEEMWVNLSPSGWVNQGASRTVECLGDFLKSCEFDTEGAFQKQYGSYRYFLALNGL